MDIYYYYNSLSEERSLGMLAVENKSLAKVLNFKGRRNRSKLSVENCPMGGMVIACGLEPQTYCLEGSCSIQLSYATL